MKHTNRRPSAKPRKVSSPGLLYAPIDQMTPHTLGQNRNSRFETNPQAALEQGNRQERRAAKKVLKKG